MTKALINIAAQLFTNAYTFRIVLNSFAV